MFSVDSGGFSKSDIVITREIKKSQWLKNQLVLSHQYSEVAHQHLS